MICWLILVCVLEVVLSLCWRLLGLYFVWFVLGLGFGWVCYVCRFHLLWIVGGGLDLGFWVLGFIMSFGIIGWFCFGLWVGDSVAGVAGWWRASWRFWVVCGLALGVVSLFSLLVSLLVGVCSLCYGVWC